MINFILSSDINCLLQFCGYLCHQRNVSHNQNGFGFNSDACHLGSVDGHWLAKVWVFATDWVHCSHHGHVHLQRYCDWWVLKTFTIIYESQKRHIHFWFSILAPLGRKLVGMYRSRYNRLEENAEETNADNVQEEPQQNGQQWAFESKIERVMSKDKMPIQRLLFYVPYLLKHSIFWIWLYS